MRTLLAVDSIENVERHRPFWGKHGVQLIHANSMQEALQVLNKETYVAIGINGDTINYRPQLKIMRDATIAPIHVVTIEASYEDNVDSIKLGADIYAQWLDDPEQNVIRGIALFDRHTQRNRSASPLNYVSFGGILICTDYRKVFIDDSKIPLRHKEYDLLLMMMEYPQRVFTYEQIFQRVWGDAYDENSIVALKSQFKRLRRALSQYPRASDFIKNVHDMGYTFDA